MDFEGFTNLRLFTIVINWTIFWADQADLLVIWILKLNTPHRVVLFVVTYHHRSDLWPVLDLISSPNQIKITIFIINLFTRLQSELPVTRTVYLNFKLHNRVIVARLLRPHFFFFYLIAVSTRVAFVVLYESNCLWGLTVLEGAAEDTARKFA